MRNKEFREIQVSSSALVFIFLAILVLGVFIFLLGVSVGKKQAQIAGPTTLLAQRTVESVIPEQPVPQADAAKTPPAGRTGTTPAEATPGRADPQPGPGGNADAQAGSDRSQPRPAAPRAAIPSRSALSRRNPRRQPWPPVPEPGLFRRRPRSPAHRPKRPSTGCRLGGYSSQGKRRPGPGEAEFAASGKKTGFFVVRD